MLDIVVKNHRPILILFPIFFLALILRFLYFPDNIYFGFDQARDAFTSLEVMRGQLKIVGPPTGVEGLFHGPLYYYFFAPLYFFSLGDPIWAAAFLRIVSAATVFLVFAAGWVIFNRRVGILAALLFAVSFEQTQYALYFNHPSLAVTSVTLFYLGLALLFFRKEGKGLILTLLGLGLSLQFEFVLIYLFAVLIALLVIFRKHLPRIEKNVLLWSLLALIISTGTFIAAEIKFGFRSLTSLTSIIGATGEGVGVLGYLNNIFLLSNRFIGDNLLSHPWGTKAVWILLVVIFLTLLRDKELRPKLIFILIWVFGGIIPFLNNKSASPLYYYSVGAGVGLLIFYSLLVDKVWSKWKALGITLLFIPVISNIILITQNNPRGVIPTINVQSGMLLGSEKEVVDFIYEKANKEQFAVKALTMPLSVNTTWSYLFEWYGSKKYGYLPTWIGPNALGFPGSLNVVDARSQAPETQFLIIEPTRGIRQGLVDQFMEEEGYFTKIIEEKKIGDFTVQVRKRF